MSFTNTWNLVKQIHAYPCAQPDPIIYFVTFAPAVAPALIDFISYGCRDIVKFKAGIGQPCGRAFKAGAVKAFGPSVVDGANKILKFTRPIEAGLFWWFVADLASDTLARWETLAYQLNGCVELEETASFQHEWIPQGATEGGVPHPVIGNVVNYTGKPFLSTSGGCNVPKGWYYQGSFDVKVHPVFSGQFSGVQTWLRIQGAGGHDFPANSYGAGYGGDGVSGHYTMSGQNTNEHNSQVVQMWIKTDVQCFIDDIKGYWTVSQLPPTDWTLSPLSCFRNLLVNSVPDPAGRNRKGHQPSMVEKWLGQIAEAGPDHGPPGGLPRKK